MTAAQQRRYKTRQREAIAAYLAEHAERHHSVDDVWSGVLASGESVGRTTVYRCLETMVAEGLALKATAPGGEARYRLSGGNGSGQLVCLACGRAFSIECRTAEDFADHVLAHHGFEVDAARTVLYGTCEACRKRRE